MAGCVCVCVQYVCYQLSVSFKLSCGRGQVLDLDSSNDTKFSRHLIFHLPNAVFTNNIHMGRHTHSHCIVQTQTLYAYLTNFKIGGGENMGKPT